MATISQAPAALDIVAVKGDDLTITLTITENGAAYDWTGATVATSILDASGTAVATNFTTTTPANGTLTLTLTDTQTTTLGVATYRWQVNVTKSSATRTWLAGALSVMQPGWGGTSTSSASLSITTGAATIAISNIATVASSVSVADTANNYVGNDVETVFAELPTKFVASRNLPGVAANQFTIGPRSQITTFPAASVRPSSTNTVMALDVMPNGTPTENSTEGFAWIDVCSTDIADNLNATTVAHVGVNSTKVIFGSRGYGGSTAPNLWFEVGAGNASGASLDSSGTFVVSGSVVVPFIRAAVGQPIIDLRTSGTILLRAASSTDKPCVIRGVASQSANMFEIQDENQTVRIRVTSGHSTKAPSLVVGSAALATTATDGFIYAPSCAGTPTGVPTTQTGTVPIVIDTTGSKLWAYVGGAWKSTTLA